MTRLLVLVVICTWVIGSAAQVQFSSRTTAVALDVSVTTKGRPVTGLTAADFVVLDNGVEQTLTDVSIGRHPLEVSLLVDVSDSTRALTLGLLGPLAGVLQGAALRGDLFDVVPFAMQLTPDAGRADVSATWAPTTHYTAIHDAIIATALRRSSIEHRRMVVVLTDGMESGSIIGEALQRRTLSSTAAVVSVARLMDTPMLGRFSLFGSNGAQGAMASRTAAKRLIDVTTATGGSFVDLIVNPGHPLMERDVESMVEKVIADFRQSYVLRFTPSSDTPGDHALAVSVKGRRYDIAHRTSYWQFPRR